MDRDEQRDRVRGKAGVSGAPGGGRRAGMGFVFNSEEHWRCPCARFRSVSRPAAAFFVLEGGGGGRWSKKTTKQASKRAAQSG